MHAVIKALLEEAPVVLDGAAGTEFQRYGLKSGECAESWNILRPDVVTAIARSYADAGSRVILTNTFSANRITLEKHGWAAFVGLINKSGAALARRAAGDASYVFGSMGPTGKMLMMGDVTEAELEAVFREQAIALAAGGAHGLVIETMTDAAEASIAVRAARETGLPVVACMAFDSGAEKDRTMMGVSPADAVAALTEAGADVIGANCGVGIADYVNVCSQLRAATDLPLWMKPNAGLPEMHDGEAVYATGAEGFAARVPDLIDAGATFVGGCCGSSPDFIRAIGEKIRPRADRRPTAVTKASPEDLDGLGTRLMLLSCEVFYREMCATIARSPHQIDVRFVPKGLHDIGSVNMVNELQKLVDEVEVDKYDAILMGYGLCNNGLVGLTARATPIVVPRAHDCITLFLGGHERYKKHFDENPGTYYKTSGWIERGEADADADLAQLSIRNQTGMNQSYEEMVEKYGEDNAKYLMEELGREAENYKQFTYIEMGIEPDDRFERHTRALAAKRGWNFQKVRGDLSVIERLLTGEWNDREFVILRPGTKLAPRYDDTIAAAVDA